MRRASFNARGQIHVSLLGEYICPGAGVRGRLEVIWLVEEVGRLVGIYYVVPTYLG